jgi:hypothetical protein
MKWLQSHTSPQFLEERRVLLEAYLRVTNRHNTQQHNTACTHSRTRAQQHNNSTKQRVSHNGHTAQWPQVSHASNMLLFGTRVMRYISCHVISYDVSVIFQWCDVSVSVLWCFSFSFSDIVSSQLMWCNVMWCFAWCDVLWCYMWSRCISFRNCYLFLKSPNLRHYLISCHLIRLIEMNRYTSHNINRQTQTQTQYRHNVMFQWCFRFVTTWRFDLIVDCWLLTVDCWLLIVDCWLLWLDWVSHIHIYVLCLLYYVRCQISDRKVAELPEDAEITSITIPATR